MKHSTTLIKPTLLLLLLLTTVAAVTVQAQNYWDKIPALTTQCYGDKDEFGEKIHLLKSEIREKLEKSKQGMEAKANKMTNEERMAIATKYQHMKPDEIVKMQNEMMEMQQLQADFQQKASEYETSFNQIEADFRAEFGKKLGPIEQEYRKLPDGEGTPQWAIKKGEELMAAYNKTYESICDGYFISSNAKFKIWLKDYHTFLQQHEVPFTKKLMKSQYAQIGLTPDDADATLMAVEKYLDKCALIFGLRRPYPQG